MNIHIIFSHTPTLGLAWRVYYTDAHYYGRKSMIKFLAGYMRNLGKPQCENITQSYCCYIHKGDWDNDVCHPFLMKLIFPHLHIEL